MDGLPHNHRERTGRAPATAMIAAAAWLTLGSAAVGEETAWGLIDLGTLGGREAVAADVNNLGVVVGWAETEPVWEIHGFIWRNGMMADVGTLGGGWSAAKSVNDRGQVVGASRTETGEQHAFYWYQGMLLDLNDLVPMPPPTPPKEPGAAWSRHKPECWGGLRVLTEAGAVAADGSIAACGYAWGSERLRGFLLRPTMPFDPCEPGYEYVDLGELPGGEGCAALGLNSLQQVVGVSSDQAFLWTKGVMEGLESGAKFSQANGVNGSATSVGWTSNQPPAKTACLWRDGRRSDLTVWEGWTSEALSINEAGLIVGWTQVWDARPSATLWSGCVVIDLNEAVANGGGPESGMWLEAATALNDHDVIVGRGVAPDGRPRAFLLAPNE